MSVPKGVRGKSIETVPATCTDVCLIWDTNFSMFLRVSTLLDSRGR